MSRFRQTLLQGEAQYHHPLIQGKDQLLTGQKLLVLDLEKPPWLNLRFSYQCLTVKLRFLHQNIFCISLVLSLLRRNYFEPFIFSCKLLDFHDKARSSRFLWTFTLLVVFCTIYMLDKKLIETVVWFIPSLFSPL